MRPSSTSETPEKQVPMRAIIEIRGAEIEILPIATCDADEKRILLALRFAVREES